MHTCHCNEFVCHRRWILRIRHRTQGSDEEPEVEANILISMAADCVNVVAVWPNGSREFKTRIRLGCNFHGLIERAIDWNGHLNRVHFSSILTYPHLKIDKSLRIKL